MRALLISSLGLLVTVTMTACNRPCPVARPITEADGGVFPCVINTDCPRPSSVLVCGQADDQLLGCIGCVAGQCTRSVPEACP